ncbi:hypothetical protein JTE90_017732 [Oedothorax gibbosus]|uniref:Uncharacterized protein n=1 Tax=Oedothorax gibbosus TaxID=931172 RepID=A0AAV6UB86_9ARAC|nr:hypothetical protein JTE90_017732 [Oedothorax gibbosus]
MPDVTPILPALVPLATLLYVFGSEYLVPISTDKVDSEYDYIVASKTLMGDLKLAESPNYTITTNPVLYRSTCRTPFPNPPPHV